MQIVDKQFEWINKLKFFNFVIFRHNFQSIIIFNLVGHFSRSKKLILLTSFQRNA